MCDFLKTVCEKARVYFLSCVMWYFPLVVLQPASVTYFNYVNTNGL